MLEYSFTHCNIYSNCSQSIIIGEVFILKYYRIFIFIVTTFITCSSHPFFITTATKETTYLGIGDSITKGCGLENEDDCFVSQLGTQLEQTIPNLKTYNLGKKGDTTSDILARIQKPEQLALLKQADYITVTAGGNDILALAVSTAEAFTKKDYSNADKIPSMVKKESIAKLLLSYLNTSQGQQQLSSFTNSFAKEYHKLLQYIRTQNPHCTIVTQSIYNPISEEDYTSLAKCIDIVVTPVNEMIREEILSSNDNRLLFLDTYTLFHDNTNLYVRTSEDDIHPSKQGHTMIANRICQMLTSKEDVLSDNISATNSQVTTSLSKSDTKEQHHPLLYLVSISAFLGLDAYFFLHLRNRYM